MGKQILRQRTLSQKARCTGIGVHSGRHFTLEILPAPAGEGITFVRTDLPGAVEIPAHVSNVTDTTLATTLSCGQNGSTASVGTVEHLMAAFAGLGIDNARVLIDGPELPILDGSAGPFVDLLLDAGIEEQNLNKNFLVIRKEVKVKDGDKYAKITPGGGFHITCSLDFDHPLITPLPYTFEFSERRFCRDIARARTFGFLKDVEQLRAAGLARGGSLDNVVVIDGYKVLNPTGLRYPNEFVRHKVLDAVGDISLIGMPVVGRFELHRSGHALNTQLVEAVLSDPRCYEIVEPQESTAVADEAAGLVQFDPIEVIAV